VPQSQYKRKGASALWAQQTPLQGARSVTARFTTLKAPKTFFYKLLSVLL